MAKLQKKNPERVHDFVNAAAKEPGMKIRWEGTGVNVKDILASPTGKGARLFIS